MGKFVSAILEILIRAIFVSGIVAGAIIFRQTPAVAFAAVFFGFIIFACYLKLERVEASLSEEKRYEDIWRKDRATLFGVIFVLLTAAGIVISVLFGPKIAAVNPAEVLEKQNGVIEQTSANVVRASMKSADSVSNAALAVTRQAEVLEAALKTIGKSISRMDARTEAMEKNQAELSKLSGNTAQLRAEMDSLKSAIVDLRNAVSALRDTNRKILNRKTE